MKIEIGKKYEMTSGDVWESSQCDMEPTCAVLGDWHYNKQDGSREKRTEMEGAPTIVREHVPLKLEVGKLYALDNGKVGWCTHRNPEDKYYAPRADFEISGFYYCEDGRAHSFDVAPRVLHQVRLNEPAYAPAATWDNGHAEAKHAFRMGNLRESAVTEILARQPMKVEYKPHTECSKREVLVPEGYRAAKSNDDLGKALYAYDDGFWKPLSKEAGAVFNMSRMIVPTEKPFKIDGPGWYRTRGGGWVKDPRVEAVKDGLWEAWWHENGFWQLADECSIDLIAKATPEQARILDGL